MRTRREDGNESGRLEHLRTVESPNGFADAVFHYYLAENRTPSAERDLDYTDSITVETTTFEGLVAAAREDELRDGRSMLAILYCTPFENDPERNP